MWALLAVLPAVHAGLLSELFGSLSGKNVTGPESAISTAATSAHNDHDPFGFLSSLLSPGEGTSSLLLTVSSADVATTVVPSPASSASAQASVLAASSPAPQSSEPAASSPAPQSSAPAASSPAPQSSAPAASSSAPESSAPAASSSAPESSAPAASSPAAQSSEPAASSPAPQSSAPAASRPAPQSSEPAASSPTPLASVLVASSVAPQFTEPAASSTAPQSSAPAASSPAPQSSAPAASSPAPQSSAPAASSSVPQPSEPAASSTAPQSSEPAVSSPAPQSSESAVSSPTPQHSEDAVSAAFPLQSSAGAQFSNPQPLASSAAGPLGSTSIGTPTSSPETVADTTSPGVPSIFDTPSSLLPLFGTAMSQAQATSTASQGGSIPASSAAPFSAPASHSQVPAASSGAASFAQSSQPLFSHATVGPSVVTPGVVSSQVASQPTPGVPSSPVSANVESAPVTPGATSSQTASVPVAGTAGVASSQAPGTPPAVTAGAQGSATLATHSFPNVQSVASLSKPLFTPVSQAGTPDFASSVPVPTEESASAATASSVPVPSQGSASAAAGSSEVVPTQGAPTSAGTFGGIQSAASLTAPLFTTSGSIQLTAAQGTGTNLASGAPSVQSPASLTSALFTQSVASDASSAFASAQVVHGTASMARAGSSASPLAISPSVASSAGPTPTASNLASSVVTSSAGSASAQVSPSVVPGSAQVSPSVVSGSAPGVPASSATVPSASGVSSVASVSGTLSKGISHTGSSLSSATLSNGQVPAAISSGLFSSLATGGSTTPTPVTPSSLGTPAAAQTPSGVNSGVPSSGAGQQPASLSSALFTQTSGVPGSAASSGGSSAPIAAGNSAVNPSGTGSSTLLPFTQGIQSSQGSQGSQGPQGSSAGSLSASQGGGASLWSNQPTGSPSGAPASSGTALGPGGTQESTSRTAGASTGGRVTSAPAPTGNFLPSGLITQGDPTDKSSTGSASWQTHTLGKPKSSAVPSAELPQVIAPSVVPSMKADQMEVRVGFKYPLNYPFVVKHPLAAAQIFQYLPQGLADGLGEDTSNIVMKDLVPYQGPGKDYLATVAQFYIPRDQFGSMSAALNQTQGRMYQNSDATVHALMDLIDPDISLLGQSSDSNGGGKAPNTGGQAAVGALGSLDAVVQPVMKSRANGRTAGIAVGVVAGATVIGSLLLLATSRFRRRSKRAASNYTDSVVGSSYHDDSDMSVMSDGSRDSVQSILPARPGTQPRGPAISQPVMSENSLGWL